MFLGSSSFPFLPFHALNSARNPRELDFLQEIREGDIYTSNQRIHPLRPTQKPTARGLLRIFHPQKQPFPSLFAWHSGQGDANPLFHP